jgi:hypothetical protein
MRTLTEERPQQAERLPRKGTRSWLQDEVSGRWAFGLLAAWYALFLLAQYLTPEPADEHGILAWIGIALSVVFFAALVVAAAGLAMRRRWGLVASLGTAGLLLADSIACPLTGHHQFGAWVAIQAVGALALAGASIRALRQT